MDKWLNRTVLSRTSIALSAGFVVAIFTVIASASFASLIFHGPLNGFVPTGIRMTLTTAVIVGLLVAVTSSCKVAIAIPQDRIVPILALLTAAVVARMPGGTTEEQGMAVISAIVLVTIITGLFLFVLGRLRLGNLIRYIPYPVIGGFLAGSGWLLLAGGVRIMTNVQVRLANLPVLVQPHVMARWFPGLILGALLFWVVRFARKQPLIPALLPVAIGLFYAVIWLAGSSPAQARAQGWLPDFPHADSIHVFTLFSLQRSFSWNLLFNNIGILATILVTSLVSILLTATALELSIERDIDLNRELTSAGIASLVSGLGGGIVGFHSLSMSRLALSLGARNRWAGITAALLCAGALWAGPAIVSFVPRFVCGGLLVFLGLIFLWEWVVEAGRRLNGLDYSVDHIILTIIGAVGFPEGVATGIIAAVVLFVHNYSRVDVVSHAMSGAQLRSNVERPVAELKYLREHGEQIFVLHLQGFIFFGTANSLLKEVRERTAESERKRLRFVVMDFRRVTGLDSSAAFSLFKVHQIAVREGFTLVMTQVSHNIQKQLAAGGLRPEILPSFRLFPDLDHGLEWCEQSLLADWTREANGEFNDLLEQLKDAWPKDISPKGLLAYLEPERVKKGDYLIRQSDRSECLYFIESGRVTARIEMPNGESLRLRSMGPGTVVGEVGLFLGGQRMASVVTEADCGVYRLSADALERMRRDDPPLALAFQQFVICLLAERLTTTSNMLRGFQERGAKEPRSSLSQSGTSMGVALRPSR